MWPRREFDGEKKNGSPYRRAVFVFLDFTFGVTWDYNDLSYFLFFEGVFLMKLRMTRLVSQIIVLVVVAYCIPTYNFFNGVFCRGLLQSDPQLRALLVIGIVAGWILLVKPFIAANKFLIESPIYRY